MKLHFGSIQVKGNGSLYLVTSCGNKQKWIALKTTDSAKAIARARMLLPPDDGEETWLRHLVNLGEAAKYELSLREASHTLGWENLWQKFLATVPTLTTTSLNSYERWMRILNEEVSALHLEHATVFSEPACASIAASLTSKYISGTRMILFFRRVWRTLGLDPDVWHYQRKGDFAHPDKEMQHYRRLTRSEIESVYQHLSQTNINLADMVLMGYSTGLRLSDIAELEIGEIDLPRRTLTIVPNKTRAKKPNPLRIPLLDQAFDVIQRRMKSLYEFRYLFSAQDRHRPSRRIVKAFRACNIERVGTGRASFHSLRATFISMMDEAGVPPHLTDAITGHAGGGMHARYTQPSLEALRQALVRAIPPLSDNQKTVPGPDSSSMPTADSSSSLEP